MNKKTKDGEVLAPFAERHIEGQFTIYEPQVVGLQNKEKGCIGVRFPLGSPSEIQGLSQFWLSPFFVSGCGWV